MEFIIELLVKVLKVGGPGAFAIVILSLIIGQSLKSLRGTKMKPKQAWIVIAVSLAAVLVITSLMLLKEDISPSSVTEIQGIISDRSGPVKGAFAYIIADDTIKSNLTESNGKFKIPIDTAAGIAIKLHYHHPAYKNDAESITTAVSQIHRKTLVKLKITVSDAPKKRRAKITGSGCIDGQLLKKISHQLRNTLKEDLSIQLDFHESDLYPTETGKQPLFSYFGGQLQLLVNGNDCDLGTIRIPRSSSSIGQSRLVIENEICEKIKKLQKDETIQKQILLALRQCI